MRPTGLSATSHSQLSKLLRDSPSVLTASNAAGTFSIPHTVAARKQAAWCRAG